MLYRLFSKTKFLQFPRQASKTPLQVNQPEETPLKDDQVDSLFNRMKKSKVNQIMEQLVEIKMKQGMSHQQAIFSLVDLKTAMQDESTKELVVSLMEELQKFKQQEQQLEQETGQKSPLLNPNSGFQDKMKQMLKNQGKEEVITEIEEEFKKKW